MKKLIENYKKPTPANWRRIGDLALMSIVIIEGQLAVYPNEIDPLIKWGITTVLILFKAWTNTRIDKNIYEQP